MSYNVDFLNAFSAIIPSKDFAIKLHDVQGEINITYDLEWEGKKYILQTKKDVVGVNDYINALYEKAGFFKEGIKLKYRTYEEKAALQRKATEYDLNLPQIVVWSDKFILSEYIAGIEMNIFEKELSSKQLFESMKVFY